MAVSVVQSSKDLIMTFVREIKDGKVIYETRRVRNLKVNALPEDVHQVAQKIVTLSEQDGGDIRIQDVSSLITL